jgi:hypothetical protein
VECDAFEFQPLGGFGVEVGEVRRKYEALQYVRDDRQIYPLYGEGSKIDKAFHETNGKG